MRLGIGPLEAFLALLAIFGFAKTSSAEPEKPPPGPKPPGPSPEPPPQPQGNRRWPRTVPKGGEVKIVKTYTGTGGPDDWRRTRFKVLLDMIKNPPWGFSPAELANAREIAISVLAHWDLESASGAAEYNWNAGGIGARPGDQYFKSKDAQSQPPKEMAFCAYSDFRQFAADYFGVISLAPTYSEALSNLLQHPTSDLWMRALKKGGYYGADENVVASGWAARRALIVKAVAAIT